MGAYAPMPHVSAALVDDIMATAVEPLIAALRRRGIDYRGVLYAGLMLGADGPKVIEYNVRFGDPETQVVLPLLVVRRRRAVHGRGHRHAHRIPAPTFSADAAVVCGAGLARATPSTRAPVTPSPGWMRPASRRPASTA